MTITVAYYRPIIWSAVSIITAKTQLPVRAGLDMDVINDIDVSAFNSEFLQQRLHPERQNIIHRLI